MAHSERNLGAGLSGKRERYGFSGGDVLYGLAFGAMVFVGTQLNLISAIVAGTTMIGMGLSFLFRRVRSISRKLETAKNDDHAGEQTKGCSK